MIGGKIVQQRWPVSHGEKLSVVLGEDKLSINFSNCQST